MEREPDSLIDQYLDWEYRKAVAQDAIPWNDADDGRMELTVNEVKQLDKALEEAFPDEP